MIPKTIFPRLAIIIGYLVSINLYWIIFGGPILLLGIVFLLLEKRPLKSKLIWCLTPPIMIYPGFMLLMYVYGLIGSINAQKRDYIVDEDFKGRVVIVESQCGEVPIIKQERLQFKIPENGIFFFNGELKSGVIDENYYYQKSNGELEEIKGYFRKDEIDKSDSLSAEYLIGTFGGSFGTYGDDGNNFIVNYFETNKNYSESSTWRRNNTQEEIIRDFRLNCK
jgi:hypothetical protein